MKKESIKAKLVFISLLFIVVTNFPFLEIFNKPVLVAGIPLLYLYLFLIWGFFIVLLYVIVNRPNDK